MIGNNQITLDVHPEREQDWRDEQEIIKTLYPDKSVIVTSSPHLQGVVDPRILKNIRKLKYKNH